MIGYFVKVRSSGIVPFVFAENGLHCVAWIIYRGCGTYEAGFSRMFLWTTDRRC